MSFRLNYMFLISISGFFILMILSILAFINHSALKIKKDKHINSGIMLIITAGIYLVFAIIILIYNKRNSFNEERRIIELNDEICT